MKDLKIIGLIAVLFILFDFLTGFWDGSKEDYSVFAVEKTSGFWWANFSCGSDCSSRQHNPSV